MAQQGILVMIAVALLSAPSAFAHHPFADEFDRSQSITLTGTLSRLEWQNPHVYAYIDVRDAQGNVVNWKVEMGSPDALTREGWTRTSVKPGDQITIEGWRAKKNPTLANADSFTLPGGKKMAAASSIDMAPEGELARAPQAQPGVAEEPRIGTTGPEGEVLPDTASLLALYGLLGALALAGALGLRRIRG